jgi:CHAT domain-containing protein
MVIAGCGEPDRPPRSGAEAMWLLASVGGLRPVEPRLTGLTGYAPCRRASASKEQGLWPEVVCSALPPPGSNARRVLNRVQRAISEMPPAASPDFSHAAGLWFLIHYRSPDAIEHAIRHLKAALHSRPESARILNDLAAAYLVRADAERRPIDLVLALDGFERALARNPGLAEALFNRGLVAQRLGFCALAEASWRDYVGEERRSEWAQEASSRRTSMSCYWPDWSPVTAWAAGKEEVPPEALGHFLTLSPMEVLRRTLSDLFPAWAKAYVAGDLPDAAQRLSRLRHIGEELQAHTRDETVLRSIQELEKAGATARRRLALAHRSFGEAARLQAESLYSRAQEAYRRAARLGADPAAPVVLWAQYGVFSTLVQEGNYPEARRVASKLHASASLTALPALAARVAWSEGLIQLRTGTFAESRQSFDASAACFEILGDLTQRGAARALAAESLHALGLEDEAWRARLEAFRALGRRPSGPLHNLLIDAALASREEGSSHAALLFQTEGLNVARALRSVSRTVEALIWRSKALASLDRLEQALSDLRAALAQAPAISDPGVRRRLTADIQEAYGGLLLTRDPAVAIEALSKAITVYRKTDYAWKLPSVLLLRARARWHQGEGTLAEADLEAALSEFERRDRAMPPEIFRYSHFERAQETFDEMIRLQLTRNRPELALSYLERARRASWPVADRSADADPGRGAKGVLWKEMAVLPKDVTVVEFAILDDRLLTWVLHGGHVRFLERPMADLPSKVEAFLKALSAGSWPRADLEKKAEALYTDLVAPWIPEVPLGTRLVFAPDRFLHSLAFAALRDPQRRRWLAEDFVVSTTPSLRFAIGAYRAARLQSGGASTLLVGNPWFDPSEAGNLADLPNAAEEIRRIAHLYPGALVLTGANARKDRVLAALAEADIVHYAGHALANPHNPWVTFLPLARPDLGGTGLLLARDIHALPHRSHRVVVLSACGSASNGQLRSAGFAPLVSSFLAVGAESVVVSLWSVEDRDVLPLALGLHRGLRSGLPVAEALHHARLRLIERSPAVSPHLWASLQVTGLADPPTVS